MTTKTQLQSKIQELEKELQEFKTQLNNYKEAPTLQEASVGDVLEDGCIVLSKENGIAILVAPKETEVQCKWSNGFTELFAALKTHSLNPSQWFIPSKELLGLAYQKIPQHLSSIFYWSSTEVNATTACYQNFIIGGIYCASKANVCFARAFRCVTY